MPRGAGGPFELKPREWVGLDGRLLLQRFYRLIPLGRALSNAKSMLCFRKTLSVYTIRID